MHNRSCKRRCCNKLFSNLFCIWKCFHSSVKLRLIWNMVEKMKKQSFSVFSILFFSFSLIFFFSGCAQNGVQQSDAGQYALQECKELCNSALGSGLDLTNGPCLGNPMQKNSVFVCDIVHNPRAEPDNNPENQCSAFREGSAKHFVEFDTQCNLIKIAW